MPKEFLSVNVGWIQPSAAAAVAISQKAREVITIAQDLTGEVLNHPANVSWGGADMRDLYIGSLHADYVIKTKSPVPGLKLAHQL